MHHCACNFVPGMHRFGEIHDLAALIVGVFRSAVSLAGLDVLWQEFAIGVLIIVAVALDQWIRRVSK